MAITFSPYVSQITLCASAVLFFGKNKIKICDKYTFYPASFLIILNVKLCWHLWLVMHKY